MGKNIFHATRFVHVHVLVSLAGRTVECSEHTNNINYLPITDYALWAKFGFSSRIP